MDRNVGFLVPMAVLSLAVGSFQAWNVWQHRLQKGPAVAPSPAEPARVESPSRPTSAPIPSEPATPSVAEPAPPPGEGEIPLESRVQVLERERAGFFRQLAAALARNFGLRGEVEDLKDTVRQLQRRVVLMDGMLQARKVLAAPGRSPRLRGGGQAPDRKEISPARAQAPAAGRLGLAGGLPSAPAGLEDPGAYRARTWERLAWRSLARGRYRQANQAFYRVLGEAPADSHLHYNLGVLSDRFLNEPARALYHYRIFLQLQPNDPDAPQVRKRIEKLSGSAR